VDEYAVGRQISQGVQQPEESDRISSNTDNVDRESGQTMIVDPVLAKDEGVPESFRVMRGANSTHRFYYAPGWPHPLIEKMTPRPGLRLARTLDQKGVVQ
jgi:hypothetical protein